MEQKAIKGKKYKVTHDKYNFFNDGEIVVALENSKVPFCTRERDYVEEKSIHDYKSLEYNSLIKETELEEIEESEEE